MELVQAGFKVWIDFQSIPLATLWADNITRAIQDASVVIVIISEASYRSNAVWKEIFYAEFLGKVILPVLVSETEIPTPLHHLNYFDARSTTDSLDLGSDVFKRITTDIIERFPELQSPLPNFSNHPEQLFPTKEVAKVVIERPLPVALLGITSMIIWIGRPSISISLMAFVVSCIVVITFLDARRKNIQEVRETEAQYRSLYEKERIFFDRIDQELDAWLSEGERA